MGSRRKNKGKKRSFKWLYIQTVTLWLIGALLLAYAPIATYFNGVRDHKLALAQRTVVNRITKDEISRKKNYQPLAKISEYNDSIIGYPIVDPYLSKYKKGNPFYDTYLSVEGASGDIFATITIPKINVDLPVYHGTSDDVLAKGVGHLFGSPLPAKGYVSILTGHTGLASKLVFDRIPELVKGDSILVNINGVDLAYKVFKHEIILPTQVEKLQDSSIKDGLVLITCYPYAQNTHRYIIYAERTDISNKEISNIRQTVSVGIAWWLKAIGVLSVIFAFGGVVVPLVVRKRDVKRLQEKGRSVEFWG